MNIAELEVKLGVNGEKELGQALSNVKQGLSDVAGMSLEAKAGILGAMYGLEQMMKASMNNGSALATMANATGLNIEMLQKYAWAAHGAGVSTEEFMNTAGQLPNKIMGLLQGTDSISTAFKRLIPFGLDIDMKKLRGPEAPEYIMRQLSEVANKVPKDYFRKTMHDIGFSDPFIGMFNKGTLLDPRNQIGAPIINEKMAGQLQKAQGEWMKLGDVVSHVMDSFSAKHGANLAAELTPLVRDIGSLINSLDKLAEKLKIFQLIGKSFEGWDMILKGINSMFDETPQSKKMKAAHDLYDNAKTDAQRKAAEIQIKKLNEEMNEATLRPIKNVLGSAWEDVKRQTGINPRSYGQVQKEVNIKSKVDLTVKGQNISDKDLKKVEHIVKTHHQKVLNEAIPQHLDVTQ